MRTFRFAAALGPVLLVIAPATARGSAAFAGMGGVGVGIADSSGAIADNPAAVAGVLSDEGVVHLGAGWQRFVFSGNVYNGRDTTAAEYPVAQGFDWSVVTPVMGNGRVGFGIWQLDRNVLEVEEPLDLSLLDATGTPLSARYYRGRARLAQDERTAAIGGAWIQSLGSGPVMLALGGAYLNLTGRGRLRVSADTDAEGLTIPLHDLAVRREQQGLAAIAGVFYRPVAAGSVGAGVTAMSELEGDLWAQTEGGPVRHDTLTRGSQLRLGFGGAFDVLPRLTVALEVRMTGASRAAPRALFAGSPGGLSSTEFAEEFSEESTTAIHAGVEYRTRLGGSVWPLRGGFFTAPGALTLAGGRRAPVAVAELRTVPFRQDVTGFTAGTGWARGGLKLDLGLQYLLMSTQIIRPAAGAAVSRADVRGTFGVIASISLRFSPLTGGATAAGGP